MGFMSNLRLVHKLAIPVFILALAVIVVTATTLNAVSKVGDIALSLKNEDLVQLFNGQVASYNLNSVTTDDRDVIFAPTPQDRTAAEKEYADDLAQFRQSVATLMSSEDDPVNIGKAKQALALVDQFETIERGAFTMAKDGKRDEAYAILRGEATSKYNAAVALLKEVNASNMEQTEIKKTAIEATKSFATWSALTVSILGSLIGFGLLAAIAVGQIARPIGHVTDALKALADGSLSVIVTGTERGDEVGVLSQALAGLKDRMAHAESLKAQQSAEQVAREARVQRIGRYQRGIEQHRRRGAGGPRRRHRRRPDAGVGHHPGPRCRQTARRGQLLPGQYSRGLTEIVVN